MEEDTVLVALGGNALKGGHDSQHFPELDKACQALAELAPCRLIITHGNGPQIGQLAMHEVNQKTTTLDELGAESEGLLGYKIEQELSNRLDTARVTTVLTRVEVDADDDSFNKPEKPIGPYLPQELARELRAKHNWQFARKNGKYRRIVPSPQPLEILQLEAIRVLLDAQHCVICAGGGGIPVIRNREGNIQGVEAVIDKDLTSALLARQINASYFYLITDVEGVFRHWDSPKQELLQKGRPEDLQKMDFPEGSMGPKVQAACDFVNQTGGTACIGSLENIQDVLSARSGTRITANAQELA